MAADNRHREKTFKIHKKTFQNLEKRNLEKHIKIEKNVLESRKLFQNREKCFRIEKYFVTKVEKKTLKFNDLEFNEPLIYYTR